MVTVSQGKGIHLLKIALKQSLKVWKLFEGYMVKEGNLFIVIWSVQICGICINAHSYLSPEAQGVKNSILSVGSQEVRNSPPFYSSFKVWFHYPLHIVKETGHQRFSYLLPVAHHENTIPGTHDQNNLPPHYSKSFCPSSLVWWLHSKRSRVKTSKIHEPGT